MTNNLYFILGGQASGKTARGLDVAEQVAKTPALSVTYIATAVVQDDEMKKKATAHAAERHARNKNWQMVEEAIALQDVIKSATGVLLIDSAAFWLFNIINAQKNIADEIEQLIAALEAATHPIIVVSDEINFSPVAGDAETRAFCRQLGQLHQRVARVATHVELMVAGIPHRIK
ncbi:MAG: bifunctional adenosylcobinamide kinase/adenosylcobinamide-phosphate guanylyltransferase [Hydrotalea sp.]|nr:bifunctional adenosylcobinamide kinase/adenosylcobinamide-phosphate guanylyltransferase [Hydrotalea sp.]